MKSQSIVPNVTSIQQPIHKGVIAVIKNKRSPSPKYPKWKFQYGNTFFFQSFNIMCTVTVELLVHGGKI